ncbi:glycosyltransferase family 4 protein [Olsenella uli]|nr:glycosyltransferase family 4 protein [Olsenella uli]
MRLLIVSQYYKPEPVNVSDVCEELVRRGHSVSVLTSLPNYPDGCVPEEYRHGSHRDEVIEGVRVFRVPVIARGKDLKGINKLKRVANYFSFPLMSLLTRKGERESYDCVICFQYSPILMAVPALWIARKQHIPCLIWSFDLWPEDMLTGGMRRDGLPYRIMRTVSRLIYESATMVAVTSPGFPKYFGEQLGLADLKTVWLPQFAEEMFEDYQDRGELGSNRAETVFTFAGNIGGNQSVETIVEAASLLEGERIRIQIAGSGSHLDSCRRLATEKHLDNVEFLGRLPLSEMPSLYADSHAMLLTLAKPSGESLVPIYTIPRKFQSYLAMGKPVICSAAGEVAEIVTRSGCGITCDSEDPRALADAMSTFAHAGMERRDVMAKAAERLYSECYSRNRFFTELESILSDLVEGKY